MPNNNVPGPVSGGTAKKSLTRGPNRKLTRRQEKFVKELVSNDGLQTARESAIKAGYPPASAHARAYELCSPKYCPHVVAEIERYRDELDEMYAVGYKRHIRSMATIRNLALENGAYSAAVMAEYRRGQAQGDIYVSKSEVRHGSIDQMSREEVEKELDRIRAGFEQIIDITPEADEIEEPDSAGSAEESGIGIVEADSGRPEDDDAEDRDDAP
jgi:phage terminase small subunit|tara:strand:- start:6 stop:647 length:642 start_codon:yes stop_codon:yes gene_type:complete